MVIWAMLAMLSVSVTLLLLSIACTVITIRRCRRIDDDAREIADSVRNAMNDVCDKVAETCADPDDEG